jgi:thiol-disulfide isomerase/thioredoxin
MFLASGCAHCPAVLTALTELLKEGKFSQLQVINISLQPELAAPYGVRSVPWIKIGDLVLTGTQNKAELLKAISQASSASGLSEHYAELLNNGQLQEVIDDLNKQPDKLQHLLELMTDKNIKISVQMGIGAVMEEFAQSPAIKTLIPDLTKLTQHPQARVRNDACHFLSLTGQPEVRPTIEALLQDSDADVRETAADCLEEL